MLSSSISHHWFIRSIRSMDDLRRSGPLAFKPSGISRYSLAMAAMACYGNGTRHGSFKIFATDSLFEGFGESLNWIAVRKQGTHCLQNQKCTALQKYKMQKPNLSPLSSKLVAFCQVIVIHRARCISRKPNRFCQWANVGEPQEPKSDPQRSCGNFGNVSQCPELQPELI